MSWQVFYAPLALSAGVGWLIVLRRLPSGPARGMWVGGAAAWFVSQVIEAVQWDGGRLVHAWTFVPEEMLEMTGSLLWGLSLLHVLRLVHERSEGVDCGELQPIETAAEPFAQASRQRHGRRRRRARGSDRAPTSRTPSTR